MFDDDNASAAKDALSLIKKQMRQRRMQKPAQEPEGGQVAPSDDDMATQEQDSPETQAEVAIDQSQSAEPVGVRELDSFVPRMERSPAVEMGTEEMVDRMTGKKRK